MSKEKTILIVDDVEINRAILAEFFKNDYNIIEADNGRDAVDIINDHRDITAVLLDLHMPQMNGLEVLREMNKSGTIKSIPVFLITAASDEEMLEEGYYLGAVDIIVKPFMEHFLRHRINNVIELYGHRNELESMVAKQVKKLNEVNQAMVETLANMIEFRDCESGEHVKRIRRLTEIMMAKVIEMYPEYDHLKGEIEKIAMSSVLHDVGKISVPDHILNKPGRLTPEEFEVMKLHTVNGCEMLKKIPDILDKGIYDYSYDICRHHHERWDGKGYPDGLKGDEISIWAQVVSVADVYDALTAERVYKKAFDHEKAVEMINNGECGTFNPKILKAFAASIDQILEKTDIC